MKYIGLILFSTVLLMSCTEYEESYDYVIVNRLNDTISVNGTTYDGYRPFLVNQLMNGAQETILIESGGVAGAKEKPNDRRDRVWNIDSVYVSTQDTSYNINLANKSLWSYSSKVHVGTYTLSIDSSTLLLK
jgi:hypothetical protein